MVKVRLERFPLQTLKKFHAQCVGLYRVLEIGSNTYELEIFEEVRINLFLVSRILPHSS